MQYCVKNMYKVTWRKPALDDVAKIVTYTKIEWGIAQADKIVDIFEQTTRFLSESPKIGKRVRRKNVYALVLSKVPFVVVYEMKGQDVIVNKVIHMSKRR